MINNLDHCNIWEIRRKQYNFIKQEEHCSSKEETFGRRKG